ncbi:MAG: hypothetical protein QNI84_12190 [Henriciella sp.]|nr:hypothetical protein [Henriciella sp.]
MRDAGKQVLDEDAIRVFAEFDRWGFQRPARLIDGRAQFQMRIKATRKAADIIDQDNNVLGFVLFEEGKHRLHAGAVDQTTRDIIGEDLNDGIALHARKFPAARFLRVEAVTDLCLFCR